MCVCARRCAVLRLHFARLRATSADAPVLSEAPDELLAEGAAFVWPRRRWMDAERRNAAPRKPKQCGAEHRWLAK